MRRLVFAAWFALVAGPLCSQAPRITPAGDPSVQSDTIYKLAVNPAEYPDDDYVYLLDDGVVRFEPDGRSSRTYRQVVQILNQDGAEAWGEQSFSYSGGSEKLTINWIRVVRPSGEVVSAKPAHEQESLAPVALEAPVYSDEKVHRVTLSGYVGRLELHRRACETARPGRLLQRLAGDERRPDAPLAPHR